MIFVHEGDVGILDLSAEGIAEHHELHDRPGQGQSLRSYTHHRHHRQLTIVYFGHSETGNDTRHDMTRH